MTQGPSEKRIEHLLQCSLRKLDTRDGSAIYLEGSIAEGFGNATSDIDFVILRDVPHELPAMPTILFVDGQRVEVRSRSLRDMRGILATVARHRGTGRHELLGLKETVLDRCQRFLHGQALRDPGVLAPLRRLLPEPDLRDIVGRWFAAHAGESMRCAVALSALAQWPEAVSWARSALTLGAKSWLAGLGETYLAKKWISRQIARAAPDHAVGGRVLELENPVRSALAPAAYVEQVAGILAELGIRGCPAEPDRVVLKRRPDVTTWQIGTRIHVVRQKRDAFGLSVAAGRVWRALAFNRPARDLLERMDGTPEAAGGIVTQFHRLGLIGLSWRGGGEIRARQNSIMAPDRQRPILSVDGMVFPDEETPIRLAPIPATRLASAGMNLIYANVIIENAREDVLGSFDAGQWRVMERAGRAMLRYACMAVLSAQGIHPAPAVEDLLSEAATAERVTPELRARMLDLDRELRVDDHASARRMVDLLDALVRDIRDVTKTSLFPRCFSSAGEWQRAIDIGYDWIILGAHLDADFPLDEARDVIATGGGQPMITDQAVDDWSPGRSTLTTSVASHGPDQSSEFSGKADTGFRKNIRDNNDE
jgi:hypothetical protein